jgi:4-alpha-glucanotransferase
VQFELDRQLEAVAGAAAHEGLAVGLYGDLALGSAPGGSDTWSFGGRFARGASVGAPPDRFSLRGQDWGIPPLDPHALRAADYDYWRGVLDANLRHVGALRIDHALGLRRLFWIPEGATPREGAYVRYPERDLLALIGEASRRHGALVVGEDLGNVPEGFSEAIRERGMLSSRVLVFERGTEGFRASGWGPRECLLTANTHDLAPLAAWLSGADLELRRSTGQIPDDAALAELRDERERDRTALLTRLRSEGFLAPGAGAADDPVEVTAAVTGFLCAAPAALVGLSLDDLLQEREPVNLPGVPEDRFPSWTRRTRTTLEQLGDDPAARRILAAVPPERRRGGARAGRREGGVP